MRLRRGTKEQPPPELTTMSWHKNKYAHEQVTRNEDAKKKTRSEYTRRAQPAERPNRSRRAQEMMEDDEDVTFINSSGHQRRLVETRESSSESESTSEDYYLELEKRKKRNEERKMLEQKRMQQEEEEVRLRRKVAHAPPPKTKNTVAENAVGSSSWIDDFSLSEVLRGEKENTKKGADKKVPGKVENEEDSDMKYMEKLRDTMLLVAGVGACGLILML